jgi:thioredoxin reductase
VHLVHRRQAFRGQTRFVEAVRAHERIRIHQSEVVGLRGGDSLEAVTLASGEELPASGLFVRIGVEPVAPVGVATSTAGYIVVDDLFRTSARRVYACGDAASPAHQSAAWAAGSAGAAVRSLMDELSVSRTG